MKTDELDNGVPSISSVTVPFFNGHMSQLLTVSKQEFVFIEQAERSYAECDIVAAILPTRYPLSTS